MGKVVLVILMAFLRFNDRLVPNPCTNKKAQGVSVTT